MVHITVFVRRLTWLREEQQAQNLPQGYDKHCRDLSPETVQANLKAERFRDSIEYSKIKVFLR